MSRFRLRLTTKAAEAPGGKARGRRRTPAVRQGRATPPCGMQRRPTVKPRRIRTLANDDPRAALSGLPRRVVRTDARRGRSRERVPPRVRDARRVASPPRRGTPAPRRGPRGDGRPGKQCGDPVAPPVGQPSFERALSRGGEGRLARPGVAAPAPRRARAPDARCPVVEAGLGGDRGRRRPPAGPAGLGPRRAARGLSLPAPAGDRGEPAPRRPNARGDARRRGRRTRSRELRLSPLLRDPRARARRMAADGAGDEPARV